MSTNVRLSLRNIKIVQSNEEIVEDRPFWNSLVRRREECELIPTNHTSPSLTTESLGLEARRRTLPIKKSKYDPYFTPEIPNTILEPRNVFTNFWKRLANKLALEVKVRSSSLSRSISEDSNYSLTRPDLMDDDLAIDYAS